jgi:hypothetical protein
MEIRCVPLDHLLEQRAQVDGGLGGGWCGHEFE